MSVISVSLIKIRFNPAISKGKAVTLYHALATSPLIFASMTTYYCHTLEEALRRAKIAGKKVGCFYGGIILKSGKRGFAVYRDGKVIEQYSVLTRPVMTAPKVTSCN